MSLKPVLLSPPNVKTLQAKANKEFWITLWPDPAASPRTSAASQRWRGPRSPAAAPSAGSPRWSRHKRPRSPPAWRYLWRSRSMREPSSCSILFGCIVIEEKQVFILVGVLNLREGGIFVSPQQLKALINWLHPASFGKSKKLETPKKWGQ